MIIAKADKIIMEDLNHRKWIVYAKEGIFDHRRRIYKSYKAALDYANELMNHYQVYNLTEITK